MPSTPRSLAISRDITTTLGNDTQGTWTATIAIANGGSGQDKQLKAARENTRRFGCCASFNSYHMQHYVTQFAQATHGLRSQRSYVMVLMRHQAQKKGFKGQSFNSSGDSKQRNSCRTSQSQESCQL